MLDNSSSFGDAVFELKQIIKLQSEIIEEELATFTVGCSELFTMVCC